MKDINDFIRVQKDENGYYYTDIQGRDLFCRECTPNNEKLRVNGQELEMIRVLINAQLKHLFFRDDLDNSKFKKLKDICFEFVNDFYDRRYSKVMSDSLTKFETVKSDDEREEVDKNIDNEFESLEKQRVAVHTFIRNVEKTRLDLQERRGNFSTVRQLDS
jgi:hypothetical protein